MITNNQLNQCESALQDRQTELINQVQDHFGTSREMIKESMGELSSYDNHPGDNGTAMFDREKDIALNEHAEKELEDINAALHAIADGTYGICGKCGVDIPSERLEAIPTADRCVEHAEGTNYIPNDRSIEEGVFSPNINPDEVTEENQTGYDAEDAWQEVSRYGTSETPSDFYGDRDNYDEMYPNSDENVGSVEDEESFLAADREGDFAGVTPNHNKYKEE